MKKKKVLVCAYFAKNFGDDLFLKILFDRYPNIEWRLLTANRNYNSIFNKYKNVKIIYTYRDLGKIRGNLFFKINDILFKFKQFDAMVNICGSMFMETEAWKQKYNERKYIVEKFKNNKKNCYILGANFGPYSSKEFYDLYNNLFNDYNDICFRDKVSYELFLEKDNVRNAPDIVFGLKTREIKKQEKTIGISIINLKNRINLNKYYTEYNNKIKELICNYLENGYTVRLFSFCENEGDLEVIGTITKEIKSSKIEVINYDGNIEAFLYKYKQCEEIIATRFHAVILAILFNQKFFPIIYSNKTLNVLKDLNEADYFVKIENIEKLNYDYVSTNIARSSLDIHSISRQSEQHFEKLDFLLK